jgi:hypothetical protein
MCSCNSRFDDCLSVTFEFEMMRFLSKSDMQKLYILVLLCCHFNIRE